MTSNIFMVLTVYFLSGGSETDVVSFLPPRDYFQSRKIATTFDRMYELAEKTLEGPKEQVQQLLALRILAEEAADMKSSPSYAKTRALFERLAKEKSANDSSGFVRIYAQRGLVMLDGKKLPIEKRTTREQAMAYLPAEAEILAMFQSFDPEPLPVEPRAPLLVRRFLSQKEREALFDDVDQLGNLQVDRVCAAFGNKMDFITFSGKFHQAAMQKAIEKFGVKLAAHPVERGQAVLVGKSDELGVIVIGNTDVILLDPKHTASKGAVDEVLARPTRNNDTLRKRLQDVPADVWGFMIGEVKDDKDFYKFKFNLRRSKKGLHLDGLMTLPTERQAEALETEMRSLLGTFKESLPNALLVIGLDRLRKDGGKDNLPDIDGKAVLASLDNIKTAVKSNRVSVVADVPEETWVCVSWTMREYLAAVDRLLGRNKAAPDR